MTIITPYSSLMIHWPCDIPDHADYYLALVFELGAQVVTQQFIGNNVINFIDDATSRTHAHPDNASAP
jgi:hypothetical protein